MVASEGVAEDDAATVWGRRNIGGDAEEASTRDGPGGGCGSVMTVNLNAGRPDKIDTVA